MSELLLSDVAAAIDRAAARDDDWQAALCEIAMLPVVQAAWRAANKGNQLAVKRIDGIPHKGFEREDNLARGRARKWGEVCGYMLYLAEDLGYKYNGVSEDGDGYSHSASTTADGIRRNTRDDVLEQVGYAYAALTNPKAAFRDDPVTVLRDKYGITVIDDLEDFYA